MDIRSNAAKGANKWLLLAVACTVTLLHSGFVYSFGAVYVELLDKFPEDRTTTSVVHSLLSGVSLSTGMISGALIAKLGLPVTTTVAAIFAPVGLCASVFIRSVQCLYFTIGIVTAFGMSLAYISSIVIVGGVFDGKQRSVCLTVLNASVSVGGLTTPYLMDCLIEKYGINGTFLIFGGLFCHGFVLVVLCLTSKFYLKVTRTAKSRPITEETKIEIKARDRSEKSTCTGQLKTFVFNKVNNFLSQDLQELFKVHFVCLAVGSALTSSSLIALNGCILDLSRWKGLDNGRGLSLFLFWNGSQLIASVIAGPFTELRGVNLFLFSIISPIFGLSGQVLIYFSSNYVEYILASCLCGFANGGIISSTVILVWKIVPAKQAPVASGTTPTVCGILVAAIGPLIGTLRDSTDSYCIVLFCVAAFQLLGVILLVIAMICHRRNIESR